MDMKKLASSKKGDIAKAERLREIEMHALMEKKYRQELENNKKQIA